tara:strand:+ start:366 stop:851 length:486 start_codon:yes stop_codon:yes gene_type:complete
MSKDNKWVIFDLDGTLADIEDRRQLCTKENGKMDWDKFFDPKNIDLDKPKQDVIMMAQALSEIGYMIAIFSGRSKSTKLTTKSWLNRHKVPYHILKLRPEKHPFKFMPDEKLKLQWFEETFVEPEDMSEAEVVAVFDDRDKVVNMWREIGLTCMQVAPGNF